MASRVRPARALKSRGYRTKAGATWLGVLADCLSARSHAASVVTAHYPHACTCNRYCARCPRCRRSRGRCVRHPSSTPAPLSASSGRRPSDVHRSDLWPVPPTTPPAFARGWGRVRTLLKTQRLSEAVMRGKVACSGLLALDGKSPNHGTYCHVAGRAAGEPK